MARFWANAQGAIVVGEGAVWVTGGRKLYRIDPRRNRVTATIALPSEGSYVSPAFGAGSLWVCARLSTPGQPSSTVVHRINPSDNAVVATIDIATGPCGAITVAGNAVWVAPGGESRTVMQIDPLSNRVARELPYSSTSGARSIAVVGRDIWLGTDRGLLRLDQETGGVEQRSSVSGVVAADSSGVWVGTSGEILRFPTT